MKELNYRITFTEELLGTMPGNPEIHEQFIASKAPEGKSIEDEVESIGVDAAIEKSKTIFPKEADGTPFIFDYQFRGFLKESIGFLRKVPGTACSSLKAYKKEVDGLIFVEPRHILIKAPADTEIGDCQRPLRADTMQGPRVALANSETVPAGSTCELKIICYIDSDAKCVEEAMQYGIRHGIGQWRNSGKGKFAYEEI